ncbi:hypothetical protein ACK4CI_17445 [Enterococcus gallinarum]|uniref:hypothetical protein n=1 Tax=Enterococcus gallinarum TaxID=1353 RepID=UPI003919809E
MNVNGVLKWLEEESERLIEECNSNADPYKSVNNSFLEGFNYALANVQGFEQTRLNENQQIAIKNAKKSFEKGADLYDCAIDMMLYDGLTDKEWGKATLAFLLWAQKREEEK